MSRYTGYNQRGFANSTVAITRAAGGGNVPVNHADISLVGSKIYGSFDTTTAVLNASATTAYGNTTINTTTKKFGTGSLSLGGGGSNYLRIEDVLTSSGDYTVEFFFKTNNVTSHNQCIMDLNQSNSTHSGNSPYGFLQFWIQSGSFIKSVQSTNGSSWVDSNGRSSGTISADTWHHIAAQRSGSYTYYYLDGVPFAGDNSGRLNTGTSTYTGTGLTFLGRRGRGSPIYYLQGNNTFIDDFLVTPGTAKYTIGGFTPPTKAAGASNPVSLYLPLDSDVNDDSSHGHTVTASGAAISSTQAKFGGNSLALDGTNDYLTISSGSEFQDFNSTEFTIEGWFYCTEDSTSDYQILMSTGTGSSNWRIVLRPSDKLFEFYDGSAYQTTSAWTVNTWHHFAICGDGTNVRQFIDGSQIRSDSNSNVTAGNTNLTIGNHPGGSTYYFTGYLDDIRILKGVARYTKNFIPPSQAVGATLNGTNETNTTTDFTALYLPFTSDIQDDSPHGHTMTAYGNATISSTQSKFGSNAAYFDGSGDYIAITSDESELNIGTDDFTFEAWIWLNDLSGYQTIFMTKDGTTNVGHYYLRTNGSKLQLQLGSISNSTLLQLNSTTDLVAQEWTHVAATRTGSSVKLFINGVQAGTGTDQQGTRSLVSSNFRVGIGQHGSPFEGYINDLRILKGYAKYTAGFTPPTSAVGTSVSETVNDLTVLYMPFDADATTSSGGLTWDTSTNTSYYTFDDEYQVRRTGSSTWGYAAISTATFSSGKYSVDFKVNNTGSGSQRRTNIGIIKSGQESSGGNNWLSKPFGGSTASSAGVQDETYAANDYFTLNVDFDNGTLELLQNNSSSGTDTFTTGGNWHIAFQETDWDAEFEIQDQIYAAPSGYTKLTRSSGVTTETLTGGFKDQARNHSVTKNGDETLNTSVKKFGTSSAYFVGNSSTRLNINHSGDLSFGGNDFTIEAWVYPTSVSGNKDIICDRPTTTYGGFLFYQTGSNYRFYSSTVISNSGSWNISNNQSLGTASVNTWTHLAVTREGDTFRCFQDGVLQSTFTSSEVLPTGSRVDIASRSFAGYIDDVRIIKGHAKYTANFTAPTSAVGSEVVVDGSTSETYSDNKFLSGIWDMTDVRDKMMQSTWISNDSRLPNGAGLQVQGGTHRWSEAPGEATVTIKAYGAGGGGGKHAGNKPSPLVGGDGGVNQATFTIPTGTELNVIVGQGGRGYQPGAGGTYGGGSGGAHQPYQGGGGGGGYSGVFEGPATQGNALIIAGGGGGSSGNSPGQQGGDGGMNPFTAGPLPGAYSGNPGDQGSSNPGRTGGGGTVSGGGSSNSGPGSALQGGNSGPGGGYNSSGGGGGGYYGGGAGTGYGGGTAQGSGGGGSAYTNTSAYSAVQEPNSNILSSLTQKSGGAGSFNSGPNAYSGADGSVEIIDGSGPTVYSYTGSPQTHTVA